MWFLTLFRNPLFQKIAIGAGIALAFFVALNWYGNNQYQKGKQIGVQLGTDDMKAKMEEAYKVKEANLASEREALNARAAQVDQEAAETARLRSGMNATLAQIRAANTTKMEGANAIVSAVPGDLLDVAIARKSAELGPPAKPPAP